MDFPRNMYEEQDENDYYDRLQKRSPIVAYPIPLAYFQLPKLYKKLKKKIPILPPPFPYISVQGIFSTTKTLKKKSGALKKILQVTSPIPPLSPLTWKNCIVFLTASHKAISPVWSAKLLSPSFKKMFCPLFPKILSMKGEKLAKLG